MLEHTDVQFDEVLTKKAIALLEDRDDFVVANGAIPMIYTDKFNGNYKKYKDADMRRRGIALRAGGEEFKKFTLGLEPKVFNCKQYGVDFPVDDRDRLEDSLETAGNKMVEDAMFNYDAKLAELMVAGNFGLDIQGVDSNPTAGTQCLKWTNANSNPIADIDKAKSAIKAKIGRNPDTLIITEDVFEALKQNAHILGTVLRTDADRIVTVDKLAYLFGVKNVYVMQAVETTTNEGQEAQTIDFLAKGKALLYFRGNVDGATNPSTIKAFVNDQVYGRGTKGIILQTYRLPLIASDVVRVVQDFDIVIEIAGGGALFTQLV